MNDIAIRVENLSKLYRIGAKQEPYRTLRDTLAGAASAPFRRIRSAFQPKRDQPTTENDFWALKDVSFEVKRGEVVGIIGRNGAGKSTLLKILSRITEPTGGYADIHGRVGSLLEVGTGFHPELTGRENIYLNGAILGMKRSEIDRQFDAIVEFAEVEQFVDTAVKHYSSGMYLRLAFAVAAHLEPEILLVDEVLAVGDAAFQNKCLGKMEEIGAQGRTVFFISHNMPAVLRLCDRVVLLDHGRIVADGSSEDIVGSYLRNDIGGQAEIVWPVMAQAPGDAMARLKAVRVLNQYGQVTDTIEIREPVFIEAEYWNLQSGLRVTASIHFVNAEGLCLFASNDFSDSVWWNTPRVRGSSGNLPSA